MIACAIVGAAFVAPRTAIAQSPPTATDRALAQSLFDDGRRLMQDGKLDEACPKLAESQRLDPGGGTLINLALCHEKQGRTASAWSEFNEALSQAVRDGRAEREASAREHITALAPKLSRMAIDVPLSARVDGLLVKLDGAEIGAPAWGSAAPVDPGTHVVEATAPMRRAWSTRVDAAPPGAVARVAIPVLEDDPEARAAAAKPQPAGGGMGGSSEAPPADEGRRTVGFIVGGVGVAALAVGAVFGVRALSKRSESNGECPNDRCTARGVDLNDQAMTSAWIANAGIGLGVVGLGVGGYLLLTSGGSPKPAPANALLRVLPSVGPRAGGLSLEGRFH